MTTTPGKSFSKSAFAAILIVGTLLVSCAEPPEKPIPPLDPSVAIVTKEAEKPAPEPTGPGKLTRMPLGDLYQLVQRDAALIYDVRPKIAYKLGHVPGAISWPKKDYDSYLDAQETQIRTANKNRTPVVIYCTDMACPDALVVATALSKRGHSVSILQGGYAAWKIAAD
jgi:rhodanese-related sulfurtransferase